MFFNFLVRFLIISTVAALTLSHVILTSLYEFRNGMRVVRICIEKEKKIDHAENGLSLYQKEYAHS